MTIFGLLLSYNFTHLISNKQECQIRASLHRSITFQSGAWLKITQSDQDLLQANIKSRCYDYL